MKSAKRLAACFLTACLILAFGALTALAAPEGYTAWDKTDSLPVESGKYYLTADVEAAALTEISANADVTIDLNGHNVSRPDGRLIDILEGAHLTIEDSTANGEGEAYKAGIVSVGTTIPEAGYIIYGNGLGCALTIKGGIFDGTSCRYSDGTTASTNIWGGAISALATSQMTVSIEGGHFRNFLTNYGGVIGGTGNAFSTIEISGGEFYKNETLPRVPDGSDKGGSILGINTASGSEDCNIVISGGKFYSNGNTIAGGGIILVNGYWEFLEISGGEFYDNQAASGGIIFSWRKSLTNEIRISGGKFYNNNANAGAIVNSSSTVVIVTGGEFSNNHTNKSGSAFKVPAGSSFADCSITGNSSDSETASAINFADSVKFSGKVLLKANTPFDLQAAEGSIADAGLTEGSEVYYTLGENPVIGTAQNPSGAKYLIPDAEGRVTVFHNYDLLCGYPLTSADGLCLKTTAAFADFAGVELDGTEMDAAKYTVAADGEGTVVTLADSIKAELSEGEHYINLKFGDTYSEAAVLVGEPAPTEEPTEAPTAAPTEEPTEAPTAAPTEAPTQQPTEAPTESAPADEPDGTNNVVLYIAIAVVVIAAAAAGIVVSKKKKA